VLSSELRVILIGRVTLVRGGQQLPDLAAKPLELLGYLLLHRDRPQPRDGLAELLWPDAGPTVSRKYLRQTLWQLQARLAVVLAPGEAPLLDLQHGHVRVNPDASWWCDVDVVERAHRRCRDLPAGALPDADVSALEQAAALSRHDLLATWQHDWVLRERDRLRVVHLDLLERLTDHCVATGNLVGGLAHGNRLLQLDAARETTHRQVMRLHAAAGDRTAALRQYRRCVQALSDEFGIPPSAETDELYRGIRSDIRSPTTAAPPSLAQQLDALVAAVAALQSEVRLLVDQHRAGGPVAGPAPLRSCVDAPDEWETG
jgi:DNA-binding SARP family transcriptional activator